MDLRNHAWSITYWAVSPSVRLSWRHLSQDCGPCSSQQSCLQVKPTVLIGLAGAGKLFTEEVLTTMGEHNERPIIMYAVLVLKTGSPVVITICLSSLSVV